MAQLQQTSITGSIASTGSLIISGSEPVQLPLLSSGSGEVDLTGAYQLWFDRGDLNVKYHVKGSQILPGAWSAIPSLIFTYFTGPVGLVIYWFLRIFFASKISFND